MSILHHIYKIINYYFSTINNPKALILYSLKITHKTDINKRKIGRFERQAYLKRNENGRRRYKSIYGKTVEDIEPKYEISLSTYFINIAIKNDGQRAGS